MRPEIEKMTKPYGRWPFAIQDEQGRIWKRSKTKGWFEYTDYDNRPHGGYSNTSRHIAHPDFIGCKQIWTKQDLKQLQ